MMKKIMFFLSCILLNTSISLATTYDFTNFQITQTLFQGTTGNTTVTNLLKQPQTGYSEIAFFESDADLSLFNFTGQTQFDISTSIVDTPIVDGAASKLGITSTKSLNFSGDGPGSMMIDTFNGLGNLFDPLFSNYAYLVFDVANIGTTSIDIFLRIGPNDINSPLSMYNSIDNNYMPVPANIRTLAAGESATFMLDLGLTNTDPSIVWDFGQNPSNQFFLRFLPNGGTSFNALVDNIGLQNAVPEPGAFLLFGFGAIIKLVMKRTTNKAR